MRSCVSRLIKYNDIFTFTEYIILFFITFCLAYVINKLSFVLCQKILISIDTYRNNVLNLSNIRTFVQQYTNLNQVRLKIRQYL